MYRYFPMCSHINMEMFLLLALCVSLSAAGQAPRDVSGVVHSSMNLTTSFDPVDVLDITWIHEINGTSTQVAKCKNGFLDDDPNSKYKKFYNGTVLGINNLTEDDRGLYIVDVTFFNATMKKEKFNVTIYGQAPRDVSGVLHSSMNLTTSFDPVHVLDITWIHEINGKSILFLHFKNDFLDGASKSKYKQFYNGTVLGINNLTEDDCGLYIVDVTFLNATMKKERFNVTIYEPIPTAQIIPERKRTRHWCIVTLNCSVPSNTSDFSYIREYRYGDFHKYKSINDTGNMIQMMLPLDLQDMGFICVVYNPVNQRNVSLHLVHFTEKMKEREHISKLFYLMAILIVLVLVTVPAVVWWKCCKKSSNTTREGDQNGNKTKIRQKKDKDPDQNEYENVPLKDITKTTL